MRIQSSPTTSTAHAANAKPAVAKPASAASDSSTAPLVATAPSASRKAVKPAARAKTAAAAKVKAAAAVQATGAATAAAATSTTAAAAATPAAPGGDGTVARTLKAALAALGFSQENAKTAGDDYTSKLDAFTHALFDAVHDQTNGAAASSATGTNASAAAGAGDAAANAVSGALTRIADSITTGTTPPALQTAFAVLQQTQQSGSVAGNALLRTVVADMANASSWSFASAGNLIDTHA